MTIDKDDLVRGGIYEIRSRNLLVGVYDGDRGFIGIREKFHEEFLFTEYGPGGTVSQVTRLLGHVPAFMFLEEHTGLKCLHCGQRAWQTEQPYPDNDACAGSCSNDDRDVRWEMNEALFDLLKPYEDQVQPCRDWLCNHARDRHVDARGVCQETDRQGEPCRCLVYLTTYEQARERRRQEKVR